jgi:hypothetical protein
MAKRSLNRRRGRSSQPMAVITVPTLLRPTYSVPVSFDLTTTGDVTLPGAFVGHSFRVTSLRMSVCSTTAGVGSISFGLHNGVGGPSASISALSRTIPVTGSLTEVNFRNSKYVQHTIGAGNTVLVTIAVTNARAIGVVMISIIGVF